MLAMDFSGFGDDSVLERDHVAPKLRFGSVQMTAISRDANRYKANVASGRAALQRARHAFTEPGIVLHHRKGVPVFVADAQDPSILIRKVDGREERVRLVDGTFVPAG
jgi:hypothetical protein